MQYGYLLINNIIILVFIYVFKLLPLVHHPFLSVQFISASKVVPMDEITFSDKAALAHISSNLSVYQFWYRSCV